jgi:hypothetical protein
MISARLILLLVALILMALEAFSVPAGRVKWWALSAVFIIASLIIA